MPPSILSEPAAGWRKPHTPRSAVSLAPPLSYWPFSYSGQCNQGRRSEQLNFKYFLAGKTYAGILLVKALIANTCNSASSNSTAAAAAAAARRKPDIGPILMVTVTNHAIDSLMEGLLDAGVAAQPGQMIRVGGRSKSERLQPYNLREVSNYFCLRAHGPFCFAWLALYTAVRVWCT
jgi:hypothetical protein